MKTNQLELQADLEWLKNVSGVDDAHIAGWDTAAWGQWAGAMHADPGGPNPSVPAWMQPLLTRWHLDYSLPFPCVAQLWPTGHDWFAETDAHPELTLTVDEAWDGPALLAFSDGKIVGAGLDRNGLRPARYLVTRDGMIGTALV